MRFISLCGGVGGFDLPLTSLGHECVFYNDHNKHSVRIYNKNFGTSYVPKNIEEVKEDEIPKHELLCAGFPCQDFSIAAAGRRHGFKTTRGRIFFEIARIIKYHKPKYLLLENVEGLLNHEEGKTFQTILKTLAELGYRTEWLVLNGEDFGIPHHRKRVFIIGYFGNKPDFEYIYFRFRNGSNNQTCPKKKYKGSPCLCRRPPHVIQAPDRLFILQNNKWRGYTPIECERIMGFPDNWTKDEMISNVQRYRMMGEAIITNVIKEISQRLLK